MARARRRRIRRNPVGTLLINGAGRKGKARRARKSLSLKSLLGSFKSNPRKRRSSKRRSNPRRRTSARRSSRRRMNPRRRTSSRRKSSSRRRANPRRSARRSSRRRRNPLLVSNPRRRGHKRRRHNPLMIANPRKRRGSKRRRNPLMISNPGSAILGKAQSMVRRIPLLGGPVAMVVGMLGAPLLGAIGVAPAEMVLPKVSRYMPSWLRPFGYTVVGLGLAGIASVIPHSMFGYKARLVTGLAMAGGAVDYHRYVRGRSGDLSDDDMGDDGMGDDWGEEGNDGSPLAAAEYADASLQDAEYCGEDLSDEEIAAAELGRANYRRRYLSKRRQRKLGKDQSRSSDHAAQPGGRWGFLIYWLGFDKFQELSKLPEDQRKQVIRQIRQASVQKARQLLAQGADTDMQTAETAGILVV